MPPETKKTGKDKSPKTSWANWLMPVALVVGVMLMMQAISGSTGRVEIKYSDFKKLLEEDKVKSLKLGRSEIVGELKEAPTEGNKSKEFRVPRIGVENDRRLIPILDDKKIE